MKKYKINFIGRLNNSQGITYPCEKMVEAENEDDARLKLYETHEHIAKPIFEEIKEEL